MKYDILLFDADNTLFDFSGSEKIAFSAALRAFGVTETPDMLPAYVAFNEACWQALERGEISKPALVVKRYALFLQAFGIEADAAAVNEYYTRVLSQTALLLPGALEMVRRLYRRARIYVVTNGITSVQQSRFEKTELKRYVERVFISEQMGTKKPDALFFELAAKEIPGFSKDRALVIGDSLTSDVQGANNAHLDCVWFNPSGAVCPEGLKVTAQVRDFDEMERFILGEEYGH